MVKSKKCARCGIVKTVDRFVTLYGYPSPRGKYCVDCFHEREREQVLELLDGHDFCPYCGEKIPKAYDRLPNGNAEKVYLNKDHMDPLALGGEDSEQNTVYCCVQCNLKKGKKSFLEWLQCLTPENRARARRIYIEKQGKTPESFIPSETSST